MIEIVCSNGDRAEACTPEHAVYAAQHMRDDDFAAMPVQGRGRTMTFAFLVDGKHVRTVAANALGHA